MVLLLQVFWRKCNFISEENEVDEYVSKAIWEPTNDDEKAKQKKNESKEKRILVDSVKDHLVPEIVQLKTTKNICDALTGLI